MEPEKYSYCQCDLDQFHNLVKHAVSEFIEANAFLLESLKSTDVSQFLLAKSLEEVEEGKILLNKSFHWLEKCGCYFQCNYDCPNCIAIKNELFDVFADALNSEIEAYRLLQNALIKLTESKERFDEAQTISRKYMECIHIK